MVKLKTGEQLNEEGAVNRVYKIDEHKFQFIKQHNTANCGLIAIKNIISFFSLKDSLSVTDMNEILGKTNSCLKNTNELLHLMSTFNFGDKKFEVDYENYISDANIITYGNHHIAIVRNPLTNKLVLLDGMRKAPVLLGNIKNYQELCSALKTGKIDNKISFKLRKKNKILIHPLKKKVIKIIKK